MMAGNINMFETEGSAGFRFADGTIPTNTQGYLNGGIVGYSKKDFNLNDLDYYFEHCGRHNNYRLIEQAGYAYLLSRNDYFKILNKNKYHIKGSVNQVTVAKHYTGPRREEFWLEGINILRSKI